MLLAARRLIWLVVILAVAPASAVAQTITFVELPNHIKPGDIVSLTEADGRRTEGRVTTISTGSLGLQVNATETKAFPEAAVRRIVVKDSKRNGALIGLVAGAVPGVALGMGFKTYCENEASRCDAAPLLTGAVFGAIGAGIGAGIDGLIHRSLKVSSAQVNRVTLAPVVGIHRQGIVVSIRF